MSRDGSGNYTRVEGPYVNGNVADANEVNNELDDISDALTDSINIAGTKAFAANQSMGGFRLTDLPTPSSANDAARKAYVDSAITAAAQPLDATLTALAALSYTSGTLNIQMTAADTFALASDALNAKLAGTTAFTAQQTMTVTSAGAAATQLIVRNASSNANTAATVQLNPSSESTRYAEIAAINDSTNAIRVIIRPSNGGSMVDALTADANGALTDSEALPIRSAGKTAVPIPASAMVSNTTNGPSTGTSESATNKVMTRTLDFDQTTQEGAQFLIPMPKGWNEGTVTFQPVWTASSGSGGVVWELRGVALSDDDAIDTAFGTGQTSTDTLIATGDVHIGPESAAITIAGTPATGDLVVFQVRRNVSDGSDTLTADAKLIAIRLNITTDAKNDA